jgi:hypothetical protein
MMSPLDPKAMQLMTAPMNPNLYLGWTGAMMNPASYGSLWGNWLNPANYTQTAPTYAAPAGGTTTPYLFNPFDPNTWTQGFTPYAPAPAAPAPVAPAAK